MINYVQACYLASHKIDITSKKWSDVDEQNNGLISVLTYTVLFVNDQAYNYSVMLGEELKGSPLNRHRVKKYYNEIRNIIDKYNSSIFKTLGVDSKIFANITQSMEDDLKPYIDTFYYQISQVLLDNGISGDRNRMASLACVINMLVQTSEMSINEFGKRICSQINLIGNPLESLRLDSVKYRSDRLSNEIVPKGSLINFREKDSVHKAFVSFSNHMLNHKLFEKAFA